MSELSQFTFPATGGRVRTAVLDGAVRRTGQYVNPAALDRRDLAPTSTTAGSCAGNQPLTSRPRLELLAGEAL